VEKYGEVNQRFIIGCQGEKDPIGEAQRRWMATVDWRDAERINTLLEEPQPFFHDIKTQYPHYYHNVSAPKFKAYFCQWSDPTLSIIFRKQGTGIMFITNVLVSHTTDQL
jgi:hypothetical protein